MVEDVDQNIQRRAIYLEMFWISENLDLLETSLRDLLVCCLFKFFDDVVQACKLLKENVRNERKTAENQYNTTSSVIQDFHCKY